MAGDAKRDEVRRRVCASLSARGDVVGLRSLLVPPQRRQAPSLAVTARATRRQSAVWYGLAPEHAWQRLARVSRPQPRQGLNGI